MTRSSLTAALFAGLVAAATTGCTCRTEEPAAPTVVPPPAVTPPEVGKREGKAAKRGAFDPTEVWDRRSVVARIPLNVADPEVALPKLQAAFADVLGDGAWEARPCVEIQVYDTVDGKLAKDGRSLRRTVHHESPTCEAAATDKGAETVRVAAADADAARTAAGELLGKPESGHPPKVAIEAVKTGDSEAYTVVGMVPHRGEGELLPVSETAADSPLVAWAAPDGSVSAKCALTTQRLSWGPAAPADDDDEGGKGDGAKGKPDRAARQYKRMELVAVRQGAGKPAHVVLVMATPVRAMKGSDGVAEVTERLAAAGLIGTDTTDLEAWVDSCGK